MKLRKETGGSLFQTPKSKPGLWVC